MIAPVKYPYRIGVDVGGTNTDAVIVDTLAQDRSKCVVAAHKSPTTPDATTGIESAVHKVLQDAQVPLDLISSVAIGTTHFINAIAEHDTRRLSKVAVIRLSKSFTREVPPFSDFPLSLREIMEGYWTCVDGGLQIDGSLEAPVDDKQIVRECAEIRKRAIRAVAVVGVFSPLDHHFQQEQKVRCIIEKEIPNVAVVCSAEIAHLGFLERENASILNASIYHFAQRTMKEFHVAVKRLGLHCPLYLTQNDGTLIDSGTAARHPIRTFSSGPTNSMCGAGYLSGLYPQTSERTTTIVCDIGGTTSDVGILLPSGHPRQLLAEATVAGVRVNYALPHVESLAIGGGSIVSEASGHVTVDRESVGHRIKDEALVFGGGVTTATDVAVASGIDVEIGDRSLVGDLNSNTVSKAQAVIKARLERVVDLVKTSPGDLDMILVGGGSIIAPSGLKGVSRVLRPPFYDVANAVGAAIARMSATVDIIQDVTHQSIAEAIARASTVAKGRVVALGAIADTVEITEQDVLPLQYIEKRVRTVVKAVGDFAPSKIEKQMFLGISEMAEQPVPVTHKPIKACRREHASDDHSYRPKVVINGSSGTAEWIVSVRDLEYMADGCYVLGCGGGGSPYPEMLKLKQQIKDGHILRIVDVDDLACDSRIYWAGNMGSPSVPAERLSANESIEALKEIMDYFSHDTFQAIIGIEIGGSNGLQPLTLGSSKNFDRPVLDADWMGRAFPNLWQVTVAVHEKDQILPCAISSGDGRSLIMTRSPNDKLIDRTLRAPAIEMGYYVGFAARPSTTTLVQKWSVKRTMSQAWRIGRSIALAAKSHTIDTVAEQIIDEVGGPASAKILFRGKIVGVAHHLLGGHSHGEVTIEQLPRDEQAIVEETSPPSTASGGILKIPFMNENLIAKHIAPDGNTAIIASVPDLITVLNASSGRALGIGEYRYGVVVTVLGITCAPVWGATEAGLRAGGPAAFGYEDVEYKPLGVYGVPRSVIDEYVQRSQEGLSISQ